jgi:flagellar biogenesis protein FliO
MAAKKIKIVVILAALTLAGGLLSLASRVSATSQQQSELAIPLKPNLAENNGPTSQLPNSTRELFYKMLASAALVIALGIAAVYISKKLLPRISNLPNKKIRVIETTHIAPRKVLHLIQVGTRRLLIASTNETIAMLADVTDSATDFAAQLEAKSSDK